MENLTEEEILAQREEQYKLDVLARDSLKKPKENTPIIIIGAPKTGLTTSVTGGEIGGKVVVKGLPRDRTVLIEIGENSFYRGAKINIDNHNKLNAVLDDFINVETIQDPVKKAKISKIDFIVIDTLSRAMENILSLAGERNSHGKKTFGEYAEMTIALLKKIHQLPQQVVVIGNTRTQFEDGGKEYFKVTGQVLQNGGVENRFKIVLHTKPQYNSEGNIEPWENNVTFDYLPNKRNSASSPMGLFNGVLPADMHEVFSRINEALDA